MSSKLEDSCGIASFEKWSVRTSKSLSFVEYIVPLDTICAGPADLQLVLINW